MFKKQMARSIASGILFLPTLSFGATVHELEERISQLEEDVLINTEQSYEYDRKFDNMMNISGYTDIEFSATDKEGATNGFRLHHLSLFFTKDFGNGWSFFSEVEYEDGPKFEGDNTTLSDFQGKIFLEAANMTLQYRPELNLRIGRFFTPAGLWSIDHYPSFVPTQERPQHIRKIFPQLVDGAGAFGSLQIQENTYLNYDLYFGNGEGNIGHNDNNNNKAVGLKTSFVLPVLNHFELGASYYADTKLNRDEKTANGFHVKARYKLFTLQSEWAASETENNGTVLNETDGYYVQLAADVEKFTLGARYDFLDKAAHTTADTGVQVNSIFANYHVSADTVIKAELHNVDDEASDLESKDYSKLIFSLVTYLGN